jgi:cytidylate kinase
MNTPVMTVNDFLENQRMSLVNSLTEDEKDQPASIPVITVSMEPGSGGYLIAEALAGRLGFDLYHKNILNAIAHSADTNKEVLDMMEKERFSGIKDFVSSIIQDEYVYSGDYVQHLTKIVNALGITGRAVIVGRGANFILSPEKRFAVRVIAPEEVRVKNVAVHFGVSESEARKRIKNRENRRKAFVKDTFRRDIAEVTAYDLIINTERLDLHAAVETVIGTILGAQKMRTFEKSTNYILKTQR